MSLVSVLTATIPGRENMLRECEASVAAQTFRDYEHLIVLDDNGSGCAATYNTLADQADSKWLFILADDDLMLPGCLRAHLDASADADIVYMPPLLLGEQQQNFRLDPAQFWNAPPLIPAHVLIRANLWHELGGYDDEWDREEDRRLFERALEVGARFVRAPGQPSWIYRVHPGSKSMRRVFATMNGGAA